MILKNRLSLSTTPKNLLFMKPPDISPIPSRPTLSKRGYGAGHPYPNGADYLAAGARPVSLSNVGRINAVSMTM